MDKYDVITAIGRAFDERDEAVREVNRLRRELSDRDSQLHFEQGKDDAEEDKYSLIRANVFRVGKLKVFEDALSYWKSVNVSRSENGSLSVQSFERWTDKVADRIPSYMSKDQFVDFFDNELRSMYEKKKAEAIDDLRRNEEENDVD